MTNGTSPHTTWPFYRFGRLVTGETEEEHIPKLFSSLEATGICKFEVISRVPQFKPRTSTRYVPPMTGTQTVTHKQERTISLATRGYLNQGSDHFVILVDDLEYNRMNIVNDIFEMYRQALDRALQPADRPRASVHFFVYMLEAYYFAHPAAVNGALGLNVPDPPHNDVETKRNPKADLKQLYQGFDEIKDGGEILDSLDVERVLADPATCASLRTLFAWCVRVIELHPHWTSVYPGDVFRLSDGIMSWVTGSQICQSPCACA